MGEPKKGFVFTGEDEPEENSQETPHEEEILDMMFNRENGVDEDGTMEGFDFTGDD